MTAIRKLTAIVERWARAVAANEKKLARASKVGKAERISKLEKILNRQRGWLRNAQDRLDHEAQRIRSELRRQKLERDQLQVIDRAAGKLQESARHRDAQNARERTHRPGGKRLATDRIHMMGNTRVDSPYGHEHGEDVVTRVLHTIESMRSHDQIDARQKMAADRFRWAYEVCPASIRCALDTSGRGGGSSQHSPTDDQSQAVEFLRQALKLLGITDYTVVRRVCGEGMTINEVAYLRATDGRSRDNHRKVVGDRLRTGLAVLADVWWPEQHKIRTLRPEGSKPLGADEREAWNPDEMKGRVAHAAPGRIDGFAPAGGRPQDRRRRRPNQKEAIV